MSIRIYLTIFLLAGLILLGMALLQSEPGYMDADYYYASGIRIAEGLGWSEPFIWNYLSEPSGLPNHAFTYWMPLAGILAGISIKATGLAGFWGARIGFIFLAALLAPLTAYLANTFIPQRWAAYLAATLATFSGFYLAYLPTTETFGIYMLLGGIFFIFIRRMQLDRKQLDTDEVPNSFNNQRSSQVRIRFISPFWVYFFLGFVIGLMYLTRTDGLIWLGIGLLAIAVQTYSKKTKNRSDGSGETSLVSFLVSLSLCLLGFLIITSPLFLRNISIFGSVIAPGSQQALWLTEYDDLFIFPTDLLTFERWLASGFLELGRARAWAFGLNLMSAIAVQGSVLLTPLVVIGMWLKRRDWRVSLGALTWLLIFLVMTVVFPYQGARGGFFHASAALQPLFWALVPVGLSAFITWGVNNRKWDEKRALKVFAAGLVVIIIVVTVFTSQQRITGRGESAPAWGETEELYKQVELHLEGLEVPRSAVVMVNNPPGYFAMTGRGAIVIPHGDLAATIHAGNKYDASYLLLDENHPQGLKDLYENPRNLPGITYIDNLGIMRLFYIEK